MSQQELDEARRRVATLEAALKDRDASASPTSQQLFLSETVLDALEDTVFVFEPSTGKAVRWNRAFREHSGYSDAEIASRKAPQDWYSKDDVARAGAVMERLLIGERITLEMSLITRDGTAVPTEYLATVIPDSDGQPRFVIAVGRDISARKRAEAALGESEQRYRTLYTHTPIMLHSIDSEGRLVSVSNTWLDRLGYTRDEVIGRKSTEFLTESSQRYAVEVILPEFFRVGYCTDVPYQLVTKDGELIDVLLSAVSHRDGQDQPVQSIAVLVDVTDRKRTEVERDRLEVRLRQAQKMEAVGRLAGGIAHDFNNLLTGICGNVTVAQMELNSGHPVLEFLQEIDSAADRASSLTHQLLAFSRKQLIQPRVIDLNLLLDRIQKLLGRIIGEDIELRTFPDPSLGRVKADPGQIEQVLVNLVVNARDAMVEGGKLTLETSNVVLDEAYCQEHVTATPGEYVLLSVSDDGVGMTEETRLSAFEPFFTTKRDDLGSGLGLATVYGIVKQHNGHVEVYSELDLGTTVKVFLPLVLGKTEPCALPAQKQRLPGGAETLLFVEDEPTVRNVATRFLAGLGYTILSADRGSEALQLAKQHDGPIEMLITDVVMPEMNGRMLAEALLKERPEMHVLYASGYTENVIAHHGVVEEALEFISKPYSLRNLALRVRKILDGDP